MNDVAMENAQMAGQEDPNFVMMDSKIKRRPNWKFWGIMAVVAGAVASAGYYVYFYVLYPTPWYESLWKSIF